MEYAALNADVTRKVCDIVGSVTGVSPMQISLSTRLREDLGLWGDDVDELFIELHKEFGTDFCGLDFHRYFKEELHLFWPIFLLCRGLVWGKWGNETITMEHLISVVESGKWMDPA